MAKITVVGMGPGGERLLTPCATNALEQAAAVFVAPRHRQLIPQRDGVFEIKGMRAAMDAIENALKAGDVAVCVSGDPGLYSMLGMLKQRFPDAGLSVVSGVGSLQYLCDRLGESRENAAILSLHGRELSIGRLVGTITYNSSTLLLLDEEHDPAWLCGVLAEYGFENVRVAIGERLSYPEERIVEGPPEEIMGLRFSGLCAARVLNPNPLSAPCGFGLPDDAFARGEVPMTKSEARAAVLSKLRLSEDAVVWDVGAGTGSVSVECARICRFGVVHALERDEEALKLIAENRSKFGLYNLAIHGGEAPEALDGLPAPTHVFVGGSGGEIEDILMHIAGRGGGIRAVVAAITLETAALAAKTMGKEPYEGMEIIQIAISRNRKAGNSNIMLAQNSVTLVCAWTGKKA
jgi:precorrin-6Y C5,15-methyltransferase (decarboxylating)